MRKYIGILIVCLFAKNAAKAQNFNDYKNLKNSSNLPAEFNSNTVDVYNQNVINEQAKNDKKINIKDQKEFLLESNYAVAGLIKSGWLLFDSPLNDYLNKIADQLLASNPTVRNQIKIYIVQSPVVNAFTFNDGKVFVNMGLIAAVKSEAQLAFILAHEISHFTKSHSLNIFIEWKKIQKGVAEYENLDDAKKAFATNRFSREQETEADEEGFKMFSKTAYNLEEAKNALAMLHYTDYAYDDVYFSGDYIRGAFMNIPKVYLPDTAQKIPVLNEANNALEEKDIEAKNSTHPSIFNRINAIDKLSKTESNGGKTFLVSEASFLLNQKIARFELCRLYNVNYLPVENLYNIYLLEKEEPNSLYLAQSKLNSLSQLIVAINSGARRTIVTRPNKVKGEIQKLYTLFYTMTKEEASAVCLRMAWEVKVKHNITKNAIANEYLKSVVNSFANYTSAKLSYFKPEKEYNDSTIQSWYVKQIETPKQDKSYNKNKSKFTKNTGKGTFAHYTMTPYLKDKEFKEYFEEIGDKIVEKHGEKDEQESTNEKSQASIKTIHTKNLGIKKLVFLDPTYLIIDQRKEVSTRHIESEQKEKQFKSIISKCANAAKIEAEFIIPNEINNADEYNDYVTIRSRLTECYSNEKLKPIATDYLDVNNFIEKHQTEYVAMLVNVAITNKIDPEAVMYGFVMSLITYGIYLPLLVYNMTHPEHADLLVLAVYNIKTGEVKYGNINYHDERDSNDLITSEIYSILLNLK